jgi:hypothetical protein
MLNNTEIALALVTGTEGDLIDLNDCAVNLVREYCRERGYNAAALVREEQARIEAGNLNLTEYLKARRTGSRMRLIRSVRRSVWTVIATRKALRA